jgi:signal transduction histidine kinase
VFDAFFRADETAMSAAGLGLGLTVCKRLIELQRGRIWVTSEPGSTVFSFALPLESLDE